MKMSTRITGLLLMLLSLATPISGGADDERTATSMKDSDCSPVVNQIGW